MGHNLFGDLNRDGKEDWQDDMLGMWALETMRQQQREAEERERAERERDSDDVDDADAGFSNWRPAAYTPSYSANNSSSSGSSSTSGPIGLVVLVLGGLLFVGLICSQLAR